MDYKQICENIGLKIKFYRQRLHLTQATFAEQIEMDVRYLSDIERGQKNITIKTLTKISEALDVKVTDLF